MTHWSSWLANRHVLKPVPCHDVRLGSMFFKKTMEFFGGKKKKKATPIRFFILAKGSYCRVTITKQISKSLPIYL